LQQQADQRQKIAALRKPIETRIKRLEEQIEKLNLKKSNVEGILTEADIYEAHRKVELQSLLSDQAYCSKELAEIEETWMSLQEELERLTQ
jgi:ATP-binding cassette subfamily F protein 3